MEGLHRKQNGLIIEPEKGQRGFLCSNKEPYRCPLVGSIISEEDQALDCLAGILVEAFIKKKRNELNTIKQKESGAVLPCVHERAGG
jgi:hypothetical protein